RDLSQIGPGDDCDGCPCPLLDASNFLREEVEEEIDGKFKGFGDWPYERLQGLYNAVAAMLDDNKGRVSPKWDATIGGLARIIKSERNKARFVDLWNARQNRS
ncbi:MAG TPA: hypothetical protein VF762_19855, partial [Blastocatellia bacterium]